MSTPTDPTKRTRDTDALLAFARKRFRLSAEGEQRLRSNMLEDKKFSAGEQWNEKVRERREKDGLPCLTIDRLTPQIKQVTNQQRAMRPAITVVPVAGGADPEKAETLQGVTRHIESRSDADDAYDQAGRDQAEIGRGWVRVLTEYCDDETRNQEVKIGRVRNTFRVYPDCAAQKRDYSDMGYLFYVEDFLVEEFSARWPNAVHASLADFESIGDDAPLWMRDDKIRVAEYWTVEIDRSEIEVDGPDGEKTKRQIEKRRVVCHKITALEVLESYDWPGKYIPWVPVLGEEIDIEGVVDLRGMVRRAKDPQKMLNYWKSATTEMIALAPKAPFIVAEGQIEPYAAQWKSANVRNHPYLMYKPTSLGGDFAPPPQRQVSEPPIQALMASTQAAENDLRAATGFFDVGERETREQSGRAIMARQKQGEHGNSDFLDGLSRAVRHVGRIVIDLIPKIYDAQRIMRITGLDGKQKTVMIHAGNPPADPNALPEGVEGVFDLSVGTYDVTVDSGPSFKSMRQEFVEQMATIFQAQPGLFQIIGDMFFENMDIPNARAISERLKKMLPPQLQDDKAEIPPAAQQQMAMMGQQLQQLGAQFQEAQQVIQGKQLELQAQREIEAAKIQSQQEIKAAELHSKEQIALIDAQVAQHKAEIDAKLATMKMQADAYHAAQAQNAARESQSSEHAHATEMAERSAAEKALASKGE